MLKKFCCVIAVCVLMLGFTYRTQALSVSASSALLINANTGNAIYSLNENRQMSMASTTKIMTALLLCERKKLSDTVTVTEEMIAVEGTSMGLKKGYIVTYKDLLYGMLLASGNDAANATAVGISGSVDKFVELMNERAYQLGLFNTHFDTPSGLDGSTHYTTASDLANLTKTALLNSDFAEACACKSITLEYCGNKHTLTNHNRLLFSYEEVIGVKTGYTMKSGRCLVSAAYKDGVFLIAVTLNDRNDWNDHIAMLDYGFAVCEKKTVYYDKEAYSLPVVSGTEKAVYTVSEPVSFTCTKDSEITKEVYLSKFLYAPVNTGDKVGHIEYKNGGFLVARQDLYAQNSILPEKHPDFFSRFLRNLNIILGEVL